MQEIIVNVAIAIVAVIALAALNKHTNSAYEQKCAAQGGTYYRALDPGKSLCKKG